MELGQATLDDLRMQRPDLFAATATAAAATRPYAAPSQPMPANFGVPSAGTETGWPTGTPFGMPRDPQPPAPRPVPGTLPTNATFLEGMTAPQPGWSDLPVFEQAPGTATTFAEAQGALDAMLSHAGAEAADFHSRVKQQGAALIQQRSEAVIATLRAMHTRKG